jgi:hypothetical protein
VEVLEVYDPRWPLSSTSLIKAATKKEILWVGKEILVTCYCTSTKCLWGPGREIKRDGVGGLRNASKVDWQIVLFVEFFSTTKTEMVVGDNTAMVTA